MVGGRQEGVVGNVVGGLGLGGEVVSRDAKLRLDGGGDLCHSEALGNGEGGGRGVGAGAQQLDDVVQGVARHEGVGAALEAELGVGAPDLVEEVALGLNDAGVVEGLRDGGGAGAVRHRDLDDLPGRYLLPVCVGGAGAREARDDEKDNQANGRGRRDDAGDDGGKGAGAPLLAALADVAGAGAARGLGGAA